MGRKAVTVVQRALIAIRLSRVTDATTSPERQRQTCLELCQQRGYKVVGYAEDLDVSAGATSPFDRPELGDWLKNRLGEFDVIVFFRADRIVRRLFDLSDLIRWSQQHSVTLVSATESHFDLSTRMGNVLAMLVASIAEMELDAISERNASAFRHNFKAGKYRRRDTAVGLPPPTGRDREVAARPRPGTDRGHQRGCPSCSGRRAVAGDFP